MKRRVPFRVQRPIQLFTADTALLSDIRHPFGFGGYTQSVGNVLRIFCFERLIQIFSRVKIFKAFRIYHGNPLIIMAGQRNL